VQHAQTSLFPRSLSGASCPHFAQEFRHFVNTLARKDEVPNFLELLLRLLLLEWRKDVLIAYLCSMA
jgi:hypothetical protein